MPDLENPWVGTVATGVVLGVVCALVVWWLERFEVTRLHGEIRTYLDRMDAFERWREEHGVD